VPARRWVRPRGKRRSSHTLGVPGRSPVRLHSVNLGHRGLGRIKLSPRLTKQSFQFGNLGLSLSKLGLSLSKLGLSLKTLGKK
jgi:hypothetical protein